MTTCQCILPMKDGCISMMQQNSYRRNLQNQKVCTYKFPSECDLDTANRFALTAMGLPAPEHCGMEHCRPARTCVYLHAQCTLNAPESQMSMTHCSKLLLYRHQPVSNLTVGGSALTPYDCFEVALLICKLQSPNTQNEKQCNPDM